MATPFTYRLILRFFRTVVRLYFREVEVAGLEHIPPSGGGVLVSWHPNGLVDPALIFTHFPRQVVFGARDGLFRWPLLGFILRSVGTVPIYRAVDAQAGGGQAEADRHAANARSLDALASAIAGGAFSALFPEGVSHDHPHPVELKTGAARLYYRAQSLLPQGAPLPQLIPVGLHYDRKSLFRSRALVAFHPALSLPPELAVPSTSAEELKVQARAVTELLERTLHDAVHATDDWAIHELIYRGSKALRAERAARAGSAPGAPGIAEQSMGFGRVRAGYYARLKTDPARVEALRLRVARYAADMRALGLADHELDRHPRLASPWLGLLLVLQLVMVFLLLPPLLLWGYLVNGPTALAVLGLSKWGARLEKDQATIKLLGGALAFPLTWAAVATAAALWSDRLHTLYPALPHSPLGAALSVALLSAIGGAVGLRYLHLASDTLRAVRVRFTKVRSVGSVERLLAERRAIADELVSLGEGLDLQGVVSDDGTLRAG